MSQFSEVLAQAAERNHELLTTLAQTDHAPTALKQNVAYIEDLTSQIQSTDTELAKLHQVTEKERKDHVSYRDGKFKRFTYSLGGQKGKDKLSAKEQMVEREFLAAWQKEREATERRAKLCSALSQVEADTPRLEQETSQHDAAQGELDQMYASIFSGPTPDVPGEDQQEAAVQQARDLLRRVQHTVGHEKRALGALKQAQHCMSQVPPLLEHAMRVTSKYYMGGELAANLEESESVSQAQNLVSQATYNIEEARKLQSDISHLTGIEIYQGHTINDMMLGYGWSDGALHDRIEVSDQQVKRAIHELHGQVRVQHQRLTAAMEQSAQAADQLERERRELLRIRAEVFERLAKQSS